MSIIDHTLIEYMLFHIYLDLLPLNLVYFVLENENFVLEMSWKIIFPWLWEPCSNIIFRSSVFNKSAFFLFLMLFICVMCETTIYYTFHQIHIFIINLLKSPKTHYFQQNKDSVYMPNIKLKLRIF